MNFFKCHQATACTTPVNVILTQNWQVTFWWEIDVSIPPFRWDTRVNMICMRICSCGADAWLAAGNLLLIPYKNASEAHFDSLRRLCCNANFRMAWVGDGDVVARSAKIAIDYFGESKFYKMNSSQRYLSYDRIMAYRSL